MAHCLARWLANFRPFKVFWRENCHKDGHEVTARAHQRVLARHFGVYQPDLLLASRETMVLVPARTAGDN